MSTGSVQRRNDEMVSLLEGDFTRWREFMSDGARLLSAVLATHQEGGGRLRWGWMADSPQLFGAGAPTQLTEVNVADVDYGATASGGPFVDLDGASEYLTGGDQAWAEPGANTFLVWQWANLAAEVLPAHTIASKYAAAPNDEWWLYYDGTTTQWSFYVSNNRRVASSHTVSLGGFTFVAGYYQPSTLIRIFVGGSCETALTIDDNAVAIPASLNTGTAAFMIGYLSLGTYYWNGKIGVGGGRCNVPPAAINGYVTRLFHMTRWLYST